MGCKGVLTRREAEVVHVVAQGMKICEIAFELRVAGDAVKNYPFHIFEKLEVSTRAELAI